MNSPNSTPKTYTKEEVDALIADALKPPAPQHWGSLGTTVSVLCWTLLWVFVGYALYPVNSAVIGTGIVIVWWLGLIGGSQYAERLWFLLKK